jgi:L-ascorbate metabolism protein UlaG (beta-lactamase superfamily)
MLITKYEHACLVVTEQEKNLVIDPGTFTKSLTDITNVVAIVLTHDHADHFDTELTKRIIAANPDAVVYCTPEAVDGLAAASVVVVKNGEEKQVGPFILRFYGEKHAFIYGTMPDTHNVGVLVNDTLYYPGDSFSKPDRAVPILAVPVSGPWLKIGESAEFLNEIKPQRAFPNHEGMLTEVGLDSANKLLTRVAEKYGGTYTPLSPGQSLEA